MNQSNDFTLSTVTVRIKNTEQPYNILGSGILYYNEELKNKVYVFTAAHCLYQDKDSFQEPFQQVSIDLFNPSLQSYCTINHIIDFNLVFADKDADVAILVLEKSDVVAIVQTIPTLQAVSNRQSITSFVVKGFPNATQGLELACVYPTWLQEMTEVNKFQLNLLEDYQEYSIMGFSGSGVFLKTRDQLYLHGIFTRFRSEEKGKVIYCQYLETLNQLLSKNFQPTIRFTYLGEQGLNSEFFSTHVQAAILNLGPRFNEELNLRLPIAHRFHELAKDEVFKQRLLQHFDTWLQTRRYSVSSPNKTLSKLEAEYHTLHQSVVHTIAQFQWSPNHLLEITPLVSQIQVFTSLVEKKMESLYVAQSEAEPRAGRQKRGYADSLPYEQEINSLREFIDANHRLVAGLEEVNVFLSNHPCLLLNGEAGSGKSHLLGDIALSRITQGRPTLLLLGQLFKKEQTVWSNVLDQLGVSCTKEELLQTLNSIGKQIGSRVLILIDALNEGAGRHLWHSELAGFISEIARYPFIGLALSIRSTYLNSVIPPAVRKDEKITKLMHPGFKGNEYAALRLFCDHYGLQQPNFPILAPEFTNPLFLQLICQGVRASKQKIFPQGFQGISLIFGYYLQAVGEKLSEKREEYRLGSKTVKLAVNEMAKACFQQPGIRALSLEAADELFSQKFSRYPHLLYDLIEEGLFIKNVKQQEHTEGEEMVYFAYERFGDFFIAEQLLLPHPDPESVKTVFQRGNVLGKLMEEAPWRYQGILEALAVLLPEKYNLEIVEVYEWIFAESQANKLRHSGGRLTDYLLDSLKWRTIASIDPDKITAFLKSGKSRVRQENYIARLIELTNLPTHPFNSDWLNRILKKHSMASRDAFWLLEMQGLIYTDQEGTVYPLRRLIDWAWQEHLSSKIDRETARLTGQTLAWVLSTTNLELRDQATKAMVNLLEEQPEALISILESFSDIDDLYIAERLYAIAYGCALRTSSSNALQQIAQYVFNSIFRLGNPLIHILLRDYARNTVEYALYKELVIEGDTKLIHPPYKSPMPARMPTPQEVSQYKIDHASPDYKSNYGREHNRIHFEVMDWDFGNKVIDPALKSFTAVSFTLEMEIKNFTKKLKPAARGNLEIFRKLYEMFNTAQLRKNNLVRRNGQEHTDKFMQFLQKELSDVESVLRDLLTEHQQQYVNDRIIPHLQTIQRMKDPRYSFFDTRPIRCWIVQRVFELGYEAKRHGSFDSDMPNDRREMNIESIGKKYQWIAFLEIMAMVADNYQILDEWSEKRRYMYYEGSWTLYLRDIDPAYITRKQEEFHQDTDELGIIKPPSSWWLDSPYTYWNQPTPVWIANLQDLPDPRHIIQRSDESNQDWLYLNAEITWWQPKSLGEDKYHSPNKNIWFLIKGFLVRKQDKAKIVSWLQNQSFDGRWLPEASTGMGLFNRENYWSPICRSIQKKESKWELLQDSRYKVMVSIAEAMGEISRDKSGAHFRYSMPCRTIFEGMGLRYAPKDGEFTNANGECVVTNANPKGVLIRKKDFLSFLEKNNLDIVWTLQGEKQAISGHDDFSNNHFQSISGVYYFENDSFTGTLALSKD